MTDWELWSFLPRGYLLTIAVETPILLAGLSQRHRVVDRLLSGIWLTACTYPVVVLALPVLLLPWYSRGTYLGIAEVFARRPSLRCSGWHTAGVCLRMSGQLAETPQSSSWQTWPRSAWVSGCRQRVCWVKPAERGSSIPGALRSAGAN